MAHAVGQAIFAAIAPVGWPEQVPLEAGREAAATKPTGSWRHSAHSPTMLRCPLLVRKSIGPNEYICVK
jgi:hypothetical protein